MYNSKAILNNFKDQSLWYDSPEVGFEPTTSRTPADALPLGHRVRVIVCLYLLRNKLQYEGEKILL